MTKAKRNLLEINCCVAFLVIATACTGYNAIRCAYAGDVPLLALNAALTALNVFNLCLLVSCRADFRRWADREGA